MATFKLFAKNLGGMLVGLFVMGLFATAWTYASLAVGPVIPFVVVILAVAALFTHMERKHNDEMRDIEEKFAPTVEPCVECGEDECESRDNLSEAEREEARAEFNELKKQAHEAYWRRVRADIKRDTDAEFEAWLAKRGEEITK